MSRIYDALNRAEKEATRKLFDGTATPATPEAPLNAVNTAAAPAVAHDSATALLATPAAGAPARTAELQTTRVAWNPDPETILLVAGHIHGPSTEQFRTLRSRLYQMRERRHLKRVLISSAVPQEGKSYVSANLAFVLAAQADRKVLLVDADLRRARLHATMGAPNSPGLSDYLQGTAGEEVIQRSSKGFENLYFLPAGTHVEQPADLIGSDRLGALMERVSAHFDWVIVDSPPVVPVSDASVLAKHCDGVLLVVRVGTTPIELAQAARQEFEIDAPIGVVFNGFDSKMPERYQKGYYGVPRVQVESAKTAVMAGMRQEG